MMNSKMALFLIVTAGKTKKKDSSILNKNSLLN